MLGSYNSAVLAYRRYRNIHTGFLLLDQVMVQKSDSHKGTEKKGIITNYSSIFMYSYFLKKAY